MQREKRQLARHWPLLAIVAGFVVIVGIYSRFVPPFEGPDEAQHFAYVTWLVTEGDFPPQGEAAWETPVEQEGGQPPLYYLLASIPARLVDLNDPPAQYRPNPHFPGPMPRTLPDNDNRAMHPLAPRPLQGGWLALYGARFVSLCFGVLLVVAMYGLARQLVPGSRAVATGAAFLTAFTPQVIYISSVASNDIPAAALGTLGLWLFAVVLRRETAGGFWLPLATGAVLGLAGLAKLNALLLIVPVALGLAWLWLSGRCSFRRVFVVGLWTAVGLLAVAGWWFVRSWLLYGSFTGMESHDLTPWAIRDVTTLPPLWARWLEVFRSYWVALGWGTIRPDAWVYNVLGLLTLLGLGGFLLAAWRWRHRPDRTTTTAVLFALLFVALLVMAVFLETWMRRVVAPYGRLLFPAMAVLVIPLVVGWRALHPRLPLLAYAFVGAWALLTPLLLLRPAYQPQLLDAEAAAALPPSVGWRFAAPDGMPLAELISVAPLTTSTGVRTTLPVRSCWRALGTAAHDYTLVIQVVGPDESVVAGRYTYPGQGLYPTSLWRAGDLFCQIDHIWLDKSVPATLVYRLSLGFLDETSGRRLPTFNAAGEQVEATFVGNVRIEAWKGTQELAEVPQDTAVQLVGYELPQQVWQPGQRYDFTLQWAAAEPLTADYQVFVHLRAADGSQSIAQADGPPLGGWYPTSWWPVGEVVVDRRSFALPADVAPGRYTLVVGLYDLASGRRVGNEHALGAIEVEASS